MKVFAITGLNYAIFFSFSFSHLGMNAGFFTNRDTSSLQARQTGLCASTPKDWMHRCDSLSFQLGYLDVRTLALLHRPQTSPSADVDGNDSLRLLRSAMIVGLQYELNIYCVFIT